MITLRPVIALDEPFLLEVYASTRADELAVVPWTDAEKRDFVAMQFHAQTTDYNERFPGSEHSVVLFDGEAVGRIWVGRWPDEIRLLDITILTRHRNHGIGATLLEQLIQEAASTERPLRHSVFKTNEGALRFYERLGFEVFEDFETYVLMEWTGEAPD